MTLKEEKDKLQNICISLLLFIFTIFISMQSELSAFSRGISGTDSSVFRYVAYLMQKGYVPYRDTFDHKGPIIYIINYIGMTIHPTRGIWLLEVAALFGGIVFSYKACRFFASRAASILSVVTAYLFLGECLRGGNMTEEYAIPFIAAGLYFFVKFLYSNKIGNLELLFCGICFASVCLLRVNMIAVWLVGIPMIFAWNIYKKQWKELGKETFLFLIGVLVIVVPIFLYLICNRAFGDFWDNYIVFNFSYSGHLELRERLDCYQFFVAQPFVYLSVFGLGYAWYLLKKNKGIEKMNGWIFVLVLGCFLLSFPLICMSGRKDLNYEIILVPVMVMPFCCFYTAVIDKEKTITTFFILFWVAVEIIVPSALKVWNRGLDENRYLSNKQDDGWLSEVKETVDTYCDNDDRISVFGNKDVIYLLCDRMSASRYSFQFPIVEVRREIYQEYISDLEKNSPKVIIINSAFAEEYEELFKEWLAQNNYVATDGEETIFVRE